MTRRSRWLGIASMLVALMFAPQAAARLEPKAKFRVVSASGRETMSFHEDNGETSSSNGCVGTTESQVSWRMTRPLTVYVFLHRYPGRRLGTSLSADRVGEKWDAVRLVGEATVSSSVSYQETAACQSEPRACPATTAAAEPFLTGWYQDGFSVNAGIDVVHLPRGLVERCAGSAIAAGIEVPLTYEARQALGLPTVAARAIPRRQLLDPHRKRLHASVTVEEPLGGTYHEATASGTYTDHLAITLKRLKLSR